LRLVKASAPDAELIELLREASAWIGGSIYHGTLKKRIVAKLAQLRKE
jgi:hypothetical protein